MATVREDHTAEAQQINDRVSAAELEFGEARAVEQSKQFARLQAQIEALEQQVQQSTAEARESKAQAARESQAAAASNRDAAKRADAMAESVRRLEKKLEQVEQNGAGGVRRFGERLAECEQAKLKLAAMEKREREQEQRLSSLERLPCSSTARLLRAAAGPPPPHSGEIVQAGRPAAHADGLVPSDAVPPAAAAARRLEDKIAQVETELWQVPVAWRNGRSSGWRRPANWMIGTLTQRGASSSRRARPPWRR